MKKETGKKILSAVIMLASAITTASQIADGVNEVKKNIKTFKTHKNEEAQ